MALILADLVQETTNTTGTGTLTLAGAVSGFQSFAAIGDTNTTYYRIKSGADSEVGIGTYTAVGTTLSRDTVLYSTAGGTTPITVTAGAFVICTYPAEKAVVLDSSGNLSLASTVKLPYGTVAAPALAFTSSPTTGIYGSATTIGLSQNALPLISGTSGATYLNVTNTANSNLALSAVSTLASASVVIQPQLSGNLILGLNNVYTAAALGAVLGSGNKIAGASSTVVGMNNGSTIKPMSNYSVAIGFANVLQGLNSIAIGNSNNIVNSPSALVIGNNCIASGQYAIAIGHLSQTSGLGAVALQGRAPFDSSMSLGSGAVTKDKGMIAFSGSDGVLPVGSNIQKGLYIVSGLTTGGTTPILLKSPSSTSTTTSILVGANNTIAFKGQIIAKDLATTTLIEGYAYFEVTGMIVADPFGAVQFIGTPTVTCMFKSGSLSTITAANVVLALVASSGLSITVSGTAASDTTGFTATIDTTEMVA